MANTCGTAYQEFGMKVVVSRSTLEQQHVVVQWVACAFAIKIGIRFELHICDALKFRQRGNSILNAHGDVELSLDSNLGF